MNDGEGKTASGFAGVARKISGWTTNLLASAIVLALCLAIGWQVTSWWRDQPSPAKIGLGDAAELPDLGKGREFWTRGGLLKVEQVSGGPVEAHAAMRMFCRDTTTAEAAAAAGPGEAQFVNQLLDQTPLEETNDVALYQPPGQTAMVVAVSRERRRIVGWSFALPAEEGIWSLYHFRPAAGLPTSSTASVASQTP